MAVRGMDAPGTKDCFEITLPFPFGSLAAPLCTNVIVLPAGHSSQEREPGVLTHCTNGFIEHPPLFIEHSSTSVHAKPFPV